VPEPLTRVPADARSTAQNHASDADPPTWPAPRCRRPWCGRWFPSPAPPQRHADPHQPAAACPSGLCSDTAAGLRADGLIVVAFAADRRLAGQGCSGAVSLLAPRPLQHRADVAQPGARVPGDAQQDGLGWSGSSSSPYFADYGF